MVVRLRVLAVSQVFRGEARRPGRLRREAVIGLGCIGAGKVGGARVLSRIGGSRCLICFVLVSERVAR